ncbi:neurogenin-2-like [Schistocerca cancellata]|uniref:neurogenin-2-like n=1 Tax=Schistocerca cancellata TaxID=274614 RepID=UPI002117F6A9|nr:neurogenin-2-like [Schistocerca cancellata]
MDLVSSSSACSSTERFMTLEEAHDPARLLAAEVRQFSAPRDYQRFAPYQQLPAARHDHHEMAPLFSPARPVSACSAATAVSDGESPSQLLSPRRDVFIVGLTDEYLPSRIPKSVHKRLPTAPLAYGYDNNNTPGYSYGQQRWQVAAATLTSTPQLSGAGAAPGVSAAALQQRARMSLPAAPPSALPRRPPHRRRVGSSSKAAASSSSSCERATSPSVLKRRRLAANARERRRMNGLNEAFDRLREVIPSLGEDHRLSKFETLQMAQTYIAALCDLLERAGAGVAPVMSTGGEASGAGIDCSGGPRR